MTESTLHLSDSLGLFVLTVNGSTVVKSICYGWWFTTLVCLITRQCVNERDRRFCLFNMGFKTTLYIRRL